MISSDQLRGARALLGLSQAEIATRAGVSVPTLKRAEGAGEVKASDKAVQAIAAALEAAGVEFTNGGEPGVKLRRTGSKDEGTRVSDLTSDNDG